MDKRTFLKIASAGSLGLMLAKGSQATSTQTSENSLTSLATDVKPISAQERRERIARAQQLMTSYDIDAIVLEPGAAMVYFTGIQWWRSERLTAVVIPQSGEIGVVCPFFEEPSIRESLAVGEDVRVWQEHESPFALVTQILAERGIKKGRVGFENSVRFFVSHGILATNAGLNAVAAEPVTRGCRIVKSHHELTLMHKANEITLAAYGYAYKRLQKGQSQAEVKTMMNQAMVALGGSQPWSLALFNEASAYPHGTRQQQVINDGSVVLMDCGCSVHGYQSDISRTFVFGKADKKQQQVWETVRKGQQIAFAAAQVGEPAGSVDDAVRAYYSSLGYGPDYVLPGLSHRTGHGIGMEGHESVNFVKGETTRLQPGMCFSDEPGIYIPGEFGVRLEDCLYITDTGPAWFTSPPESLAAPLGKLVPLAL
ncbi:M24 family metallopeptidase [Alteromonas lipolytica]|uniref:Peptidase n=1 Tax=Alteromonas lipolytica TaxID=1856405 RepID=A0A1E8FDF6_9ALTE|nr:Xaa-Pro peptidase family protein [Alteromonas lipolytica]OFI33965.1 peptidase [Alteromonas lipolytica]GGF66854.1 metallopeptidase [Alteromonas lipolytica]